MRPTRYATSATTEVLRSSLSDRLIAITGDVARLNVATARQLRTLHYADTETGRRLARRELARLVQLRVLAKLDRRIGGVRGGSDNYTFALDVAGQRLVYPGRDRYRAPWTPQVHQLRHALAVSELYVGLRTTVPAGVRLRFDAEPRCWRTFTGPGGATDILKPDAFVSLEAADYEDRYFIEIDRSTESARRITGKAAVYARYFQSGREQAEHGVFPLVTWIGPDARRAAWLATVLARAPGSDAGLHVTSSDLDAARQLLAADFSQSAQLKKGGSP